MPTPGSGRKLPSTSASMSAIVAAVAVTTRSVAPSSLNSPRWNAMRSEPLDRQVDDAEVAFGDAVVLVHPHERTEAAVGDCAWP